MTDFKNPFLEMFESFGSQMQIPKPDLSQMMDSHQKNLEALQKAAEISTNSAQSAFEAQRAALETTLSDIAKGVTTAMAGDVSASMAEQIEMAKRSFDTTMGQMHQITEIMQSGNAEAMAVLRDRVVESVQEMTSLPDSSKR